MTPESKKYVSIKVPKSIYESIRCLKEVIIMNGIEKFPEEFKNFLKENDARIYQNFNISMGNIVNLITLAIKFMFPKIKE